MEDREGEAGMIGPYTGFAWAGYAICNAVIPFIRGMDGASFWLTLLFAPVWSFCFTMAYRKEIVAANGRFIGFVIFNALLALPAIIASYWIGRFAG